MKAADKDAFDFLSSLEFFGIKLGLDQTRELFRRMGNPEKELKFIHVAGSNGKGSVCALMEGAFRHAGLKTGFYSSPHLISVCERFRINGQPVAEEVCTEAIRKLMSAAEAMKRDGMHVTYFEATTALAAWIFRQAGAEVVLWETGMGGRLDATNIVTPLASVITGISLEHRQYLGNTLAEIAFEKAGIIKDGVPVFCSGRTPDEAKKVIRARAEALHAPYIEPELPSEKPLVEYEEKSGAFRQHFHLPDGTSLTIRLPGPHQRRNAALAAAVVRKTAPELGVNGEKALEGFADVTWDARFQFVPERNLIVDGGHNPEGIGVLADTLEELFPGEKFHFLFGAFADKETAESLARLAPLANRFTFLEMETRRASFGSAELGGQLRKSAPGIAWDTMTLEDALVSEQGKKVLCGSLHLCGDALAILKK